MIFAAFEAKYFFIWTIFLMMSFYFLMLISLFLTHSFPLFPSLTISTPVIIYLLLSLSQTHTDSISHTSSLFLLFSSLSSLFSLSPFSTSLSPPSAHPLFSSHSHTLTLFSSLSLSHYLFSCHYLSLLLPTSLLLPFPLSHSISSTLFTSYLSVSPISSISFTLTSFHFL